MTYEVEATVTNLHLVAVPEGGLGVVVYLEVQRRITAVARADVSSAWLRGLVEVLGGHVSGGEPRACLLRHDSAGCLTDIGSPDGSRWIDVSAPQPPPVPPERWPGETAQGRAALRFLNARRARAALRDLDPVAAGYNDDDIIADALLYGWPG
jgi:hypothetical protein